MTEQRIGKRESVSHLAFAFRNGYDGLMDTQGGTIKNVLVQRIEVTPSIAGGKPPIAGHRIKKKLGG